MLSALPSQIRPNLSLRDFQIKKYSKFSCGVGTLPALNPGRARMPIPQDGEFNFWKSLRGKFFLFSLLPLLFTTPVLAETKGNILLAQSGEQLPPPPPINQTPYTRVNNSDRSIEFQAPPSSNPQYQQVAPTYQYNAPTYQYNNQAAERFAVYVDASNYNNYQVLSMVKQVEPSAFIRNFDGRSVIQAGTFNRQQNAIARIQRLLSTGLNLSNIRLFSLTTVGGSSNNRGNIGINQKRSSYYYVAIPARSEELPAIEDRIWRSLGRSLGNISVLRRNSPRGTHIAVGPFADRGLAEQWNAAIKKVGLGNARVYYGK
jgi:hypothetical protein